MLSKTLYINNVSWISWSLKQLGSSQPSGIRLGYKVSKGLLFVEVFFGALKASRVSRYNAVHLGFTIQHHRATTLPG